MQLKKTALIVDDEADILDVLCYEIGRLGMNTVRAANPQEARMRLGFQPFDLVITDIMMPRESGIEFLISINQLISKKRLTSPPIIICTAMDLDETIREKLVKTLKVELILQKPWDSNVLRQFVEKKVLGRLAP